MSRDLPPDDFRAAMHRVADLVADYLEGVGDRPVLPPVSPGEVRRVLPASPPDDPEPIDTILDDYLRVIEPNLTHWNHPGFLAYFSITGSGPGILGETLAAALNVNAMLWRTGPAPTELEERVCEWLARMMDLPADFRGHINDTASSSSLVALAAARHRLPGLDVRVKGLAGRPDAPPLTVYCSDQAHSSIDKAAIVLGIGQENVRRIASDGAFRLSVPALAEAVARDRAAGRLPMAIVATVGSTSTTSIDPVPEIADLCAREGIWLHVDAAYAGSAAICPEYRALMPGLERADSLVVNPHKWLFTPVDCSVLFVRDLALLKGAFSLVPEYLRTGESSEVTNLMDLGFQLGRRFRSLKLWMVIRAFGVEGLRSRIREHCAMARDLAARIEADPRFELAAPVPFSTVCFRARMTETTGSPEDQDRLNERLMARVNAAGPFLLSHTGLKGRYTLRVAIGNLRTEPEHLTALWQLVGESLDEVLAEV
ncbi:MAG: aromatic-L-amino-acid/L-tryptophan decarboxylase [Acidobacteriota bacterium]|jgi:aromatic-L-amino-acid decarboxylase|nr:aromatic-L-amino-acid/L-tryptophan decarboxylase [Acidobacteriota bacterium]